jgi:histidinol-phosphate/aromatic aminotransferase/cobyric acid decarboxylase-like protein
LRAAVAALAEKSTLVRQRRANNTRIRSEFCAWLRAQKVSFVEPHANFVFVDVGRDVKAFGAAMKAKGVAVGRQFPPFNNMCRITIGTDDEMRRFREAYETLS